MPDPAVADDVSARSAVRGRTANFRVTISKGRRSSSTVPSTQGSPAISRSSSVDARHPHDRQRGGELDPAARPPRLAHAHDERVLAVGLLHRFDRHVRPVGAHDRRGQRPGAGTAGLGAASPRAGTLNASASAITPAARRSPPCGKSAYAKRCGPWSLSGSGQPGRAQQREAHHVAVDVVSVLAVVEQRDAVAGLAQIGPPVRAHLEAGDVPRRVHVRRPLEVPELDLVGRAARVHVDRERDLQELVVLVPVDLGVEVEAARAAHEPHRLRDPRRAELADEAHRARAAGRARRSRSR